TADRKSQLSRFGDDAYWATTQQMQPLPWHKTSPRYVRRLAAIAAVLTGVLLGGYLLFVQPGSNHSTPSTDPRWAQQPSVQLQLAGGQIIDLSNTEGKLKTGDVTLQHNSKTLSYGENATETTMLSSLNTLRVPVGLDYKVLLSDGTEIWLNSATELRFPFSFSNAAREISLQGEAYLKVAEDPKRPFIVHTLKGSSIQVLGTSFNVNTYDSLLLRVALVEGAIKLNTASKQTLLQRGQEALYQPAKESIEIKPFDKENVLSWREGILYFDNATLEEICSVFPRWFGQDIRMDNAAVGQKRFSGILDRKKPAIEFIHALQTTAALEYYIDQNKVIHIK
ncbi:MAG TPA: FecR domain-containing protein, partial [Chitinophaga sp.]